MRYRRLKRIDVISHYDGTDHFLKKLVKKITNTAVNIGLKNVQKDAAKHIGEEEAKKLTTDLQTKMDTDPMFQKKLNEVNNAGTAILATSAILGAGALAAPALAAAGGGGAAAGGGAGLAGTAIKVAADTAAKPSTATTINKALETAKSVNKAATVVKQLTGNLKPTTTSVSTGIITPGTNEQPIDINRQNNGLPNNVPAGGLQDVTWNTPTGGFSMPTFTAGGLELNPLMIGGILIAVILLFFVIGKSK